MEGLSSEASKEPNEGKGKNARLCVLKAEHHRNDETGELSDAERHAMQDQAVSA